MKPVASKCKKIALELLAHAKLYISRQPLLRPIAFAILEKFPELAKYIRKHSRPPDRIDYTDLSPRARCIYADLKAAMNSRNKDPCES